MINFNADTNAQRAANGDLLTDLHTEWTAAAGPVLTEGGRARLGRALAEVHHGGPVKRSEAAPILCDVLTDLFHSADGHLSPTGLLSAACAELRATAPMTGDPLDLGEDGRPGRTASALASVLDYADLCGFRLENLAVLAHTKWSDEVEAERFAHIRATRRR
ncbi:hypothetical protein [Streptomyces sp. NPDC020817]|uniref:hypothetical protein n=1 Tax=Streptomyces sp. NPDC020817 TaxID=3365095 RepID=UPI00378AC706